MSSAGDTGPGGDPRDDRALLAAHVAGDHAAFGVLFARHRDRLWAVALRTMGDPDDAADGLQDAMVAAFRRAGSYRGDAAVTTWLHRVVVNACLDRLRASGVRRTAPLPDDLEEHATRGAVATQHSRPGGGAGSEQWDDPADIAVRREQQSRIIAALAALPPEQRAALVLVDMEGMPVAEAADVLQCAEGTVKSRCSRGRRRLAALLGLEDGPPGNRPDSGPVPPLGDRSSPRAARPHHARAGSPESADAPDRRDSPDPVKEVEP